MAKRRPQQALTVVTIPLTALQPAENNPRIMPQREMEALKNGLDHWGFVDPIIARRLGPDSYEIIGGHQRVTAAQELGITEVPVIVLEVSAVDAMILNEALNRIHGTWDEAQLALHQEAIRLSGGDLNLTGFTAGEINLVRSGHDLAGRIIEVPMEKTPDVPIVQPGDVWALGPHRLVCGDAADPSAVSKALADQPVGVLFTDPPYGVDYDPEKRPTFPGGLRKRGNLGTIEGDKVEGDEYTAWLTEILAALPLSAGVAAYVCHASTVAEFALRAFRLAGFNLSSVIIWAKSTGIFGRPDYHWQHEPIMYGWRQGSAHRWFGDHTQTTLWSLPTDHLTEGLSKEESKYLHPTQKPILLAAKAVQNSSLEGDVVLDVFAGSGSTLLAAAQLGRIGAAVELEPRWCDAIVLRWERLTGEKAERI
jgi:DNA modification methylase